MLFRIRSFDTDSTARVPTGFVEMGISDFARTSSFGVVHLHETAHYWFLSESNLLALNTFIGNGYCKMVKRAITDENGLMFRDANGEPLVEPDNT